MTPTSEPMPTETAPPTVSPTPTITPTVATGETLVDLDFSVTVGIWGIEPRCSGLSTLQVPANTTVVYCYTVRNGTAQTASLHTLVDSEWGVLLDRMRVELPPGGVYTHVISRTLTTTTTTTSTWTAWQSNLLVMGRSALVAHKADVSPLAMSAFWRPFQGVAQSPRWATNGSATSTVYISGPTADQDADGIPDNVESADDFDGDNLPNFLDTDSDGDRRPDVTEGAVDLDQDGQLDFIDYDPLSPTEEETAPEPVTPLGALKLYLPIIRNE